VREGCSPRLVNQPDITPDITVVIPFLNEADSIERLGNELMRFTAARRDTGFEVILVDDGSTDDSVDVIKKTKFPSHTRLISLSQNYGSHAALRAGVRYAKGRYITFLYADLQDPIENIEIMYSRASSGCDIVWATRATTQNSFVERQFSNLYSMLMRRYVNSHYPNKGFDVVLFNRKVADELNRNIETNSSVFLQILNMGFKQDFVEYEKAARIVGKSKWTTARKIKLVIDSFVAFSSAPVRLVSLVGISFFIGGSLWTSYIVLRTLIVDDLERGWPALISILMIGFGITNISLGIIAEYLWRTLDVSRKRPAFIVDQVREHDQL
jgi:dolichol-phosphate mannosyltransferase